MSDKEPPVDSAAEPATQAIEQGTYEVIRDRLLQHGRTLAARAESLNTRRIELFGGMQLAVIGNVRIRTENNCVPRDILPIGDSLLFGYNVYLGLKTEIRLDDVFSLHRVAQGPNGYEVEAVENGGTAFLADKRFRQDYEDLHRFYKGARLLNLRRVGERILAVFQVGEKLDDVKAFRWSIDTAGGITYLDNQGDRDHIFPPSHDFTWTPTTRDDHVTGNHPHVNILNEVFVETVGGDLTVKIENNSDDGEGIYAEPVDEPEQSLDDAQIDYARLGTLILMRVLPYREEEWRYLIFNTLTKTVARIDHIGRACVQLPEDHGVIYPGGYYLQRGETKTFDTNTDGMVYERVIRSPNGEDVLYVFYHRREGRYALLPYNLIRKEVATPMHGHGYSLLDDGTLILLKAQSDDPTRVHPLQIWTTPFTTDVYAAERPVGDSPLQRIGNADLVRGISDCLSIRRLVEGQTPSRQLYEALIAAVQRTLDLYHWLGSEEAGDLQGSLKEISQAAELIVDEFEKVQTLRSEARGALSRAETGLRAVFASLRPDFWKQVDEFVEALSQLRKERGKLISLRAVRYIDLARVDELEQDVIARFDEVSAKCVEFLLAPQALAPYHARIDALESQISGVAKVTETKPLGGELIKISDGLGLLTEVVGGLAIEDATVRTRILQGISEVMSQGNRARALLTARRKELLSKEGVAEFAAQFALFGQSVTSALALAETPESCDEALSRLLLALEELEGRFSEFDQFMEQLAAKRDEVVEIVGGKKQMLLDQRQRRAQNLTNAADRILSSVGRRASTFGELDDLNAYFASDAMVMKLRDLSERLRDLEDSVRADEVDSRLKSAREDAVRSLRDRQDIFEDGQSVIRLGRHRFSVNTQPLDLTMVPRGDGLSLHLSGTDFYQPIEDEKFLDTRPYWNQELVSETRHVYRAEYLAYCLLNAAEQQQEGRSLPAVYEAMLDEADLIECIREFAATRYDEGYERGVHDADAARILIGIGGLYRTAGLLRFAPIPRAVATLFWSHFDDAGERERFLREASSLARLRAAFRTSPAILELEATLSEAVEEFCEENGWALDEGRARQAGRYLFEQLAVSPEHFVVSGEAVELADAFIESLRLAGTAHEFEEDMRQLSGSLSSRYRITRAWLEAWVAHESPRARLAPVVPEATVLLVNGDRSVREVSSALGSVKVDGLLGQHPSIRDQTLSLRLDEFLARLSTFAAERVPAFRAYQERRHAIVTVERERLRLEEFKPRVLSSFVRNRLIDEVYLPIFGDNLAKQLGALGEGKRTDLMGLLLLISPPGYGKTTLMEYLANRLGLVFMKINGPALGHAVRSLDPAEAANATARQEVNKINLALEMGNNVLLYLDDIQHTHPELLQKFISLCDAQRKIEGVWRGRTRTYDLRGKKFVVCMAGNPYTESGETFQIPDMLANRADVYNLGDILGGKGELFSMSYIENALTSNRVLAQIATHAHKDVHLLARMARGEEIPASSLEYPYSQVELEEILSVLRKVLRCQEVLLAVNATYIASASMDDAYRTEPPFKLQGSYRNMNKLAEKIVPVMNDEELEQLLADHYVGEAQTLTSDAEQNLLKLAELRGKLSPEQAVRWSEIKELFCRQQMMGGAEDDPVARVTGQLVTLSEHVKGIGTHIEQHAQRSAESERALAALPAPDVGGRLGETLGPHLARLHQELAGLAQSQPPVGAPSPTLDPAASTGATDRTGEQIAAALTPYVQRLDSVLKALSSTQGDAAAESNSEYDPHRLAAHQIQVIEAGLLPVLRSMNVSLKINKAVWERMGKVLAALRQITGEAVDDGEPTDD